MVRFTNLNSYLSSNNPDAIRNSLTQRANDLSQNSLATIGNQETVGATPDINNLFQKDADARKNIKAFNEQNLNNKSFDASGQKTMQLNQTLNDLTLDDSDQSRMRAISSVYKNPGYSQGTLGLDTALLTGSKDGLKTVQDNNRAASTTLMNTFRSNREGFEKSKNDAIQKQEALRSMIDRESGTINTDIQARLYQYQKDSLLGGVTDASQLSDQQRKRIRLNPGETLGTVKLVDFAQKNNIDRSSVMNAEEFAKLQALQDMSQQEILGNIDKSRLGTVRQGFDFDAARSKVRQFNNETAYQARKNQADEEIEQFKRDHRIGMNLYDINNARMPFDLLQAGYGAITGETQREAERIRDAERRQRKGIEAIKRKYGV
jgi:hypothetical protein